MPNQSIQVTMRLPDHTLSLPSGQDPHHHAHSSGLQPPDHIRHDHASPLPFTGNNGSRVYHVSVAALYCKAGEGVDNTTAR